MEMAEDMRIQYKSHPTYFHALNSKYDIEYFVSTYTIRNISQTLNNV